MQLNYNSSTEALHAASSDWYQLQYLVHVFIHHIRLPGLRASQSELATDGQTQLRSGSDINTTRLSLGSRYLLCYKSISTAIS